MLPSVCHLLQVIFFKKFFFKCAEEKLKTEKIGAKSLKLNVKLSLGSGCTHLSAATVVPLVTTTFIVTNSEFLCCRTVSGIFIQIPLTQTFCFSFFKILMYYLNYCKPLFNILIQLSTELHCILSLITTLEVISQLVSSLVIRSFYYVSSPFCSLFVGLARTQFYSSFVGF